ncbi:hypothetical protein J3F84DRAFT_388890 [Trichoderma pleuroticola]
MKECASMEDSLNLCALPLRLNYPELSWIICRLGKGDLYVNKPGIWVPISVCDGCKIIDRESSYNLAVGKKYQKLNSSGLIALRVEERVEGRGMLYLLWFFKR